MRSIAVLRVLVEPLEDACVIRATGELDFSTADRLRAGLDAARADGMTTLVDLAGVNFVDSAGLRVLLDAARDSDKHEWPWFIVRPSSAVLRLIELAGAASRLPLVAPRPGMPAPERAPVMPLRGARRAATRRAGRA